MQNNLTSEAQPLLLDNAVGHPDSLRDLNENVRICFLLAFEASYLKWTFRLVIDATRGYRAFSVAEFWKKYKIKHALENIQAL